MHANNFRNTLSEGNFSDTLSGTTGFPTFDEVSGPLPYSMTNDLLSKLLLERNELVLKSLLGSLLYIPADSITDIKILNPYIHGQTLVDKSTILDLRVTINNELRINLEIQVAKEDFWRERSILYTGRLYDFLSHGERYDNLQRSIHIGILDFNLFPEKQAQFYAKYMLMNVKTHELYSDKIQINVLQLNQINHATEEDKVYNIHLWAKFFKATTWEDLKMLAMEDSVFLEAGKTIYNLTLEDVHRDNLRNREKYLASMRTREAQERKLIDELEATNVKLAEFEAKLAAYETKYGKLE